jgi:hypothetical protein
VTCAVVKCAVNMSTFLVKGSVIVVSLTELVLPSFVIWFTTAVKALVLVSEGIT